MEVVGAAEVQLKVGALLAATMTHSTWPDVYCYRVSGGLVKPHLAEREKHHFQAVIYPQLSPRHSYLHCLSDKRSCFTLKFNNSEKGDVARSGFCTAPVRNCISPPSRSRTVTPRCYRLAAIRVEQIVIVTSERSDVVVGV